MATEHEVDRMVVRLIGDQESYQKMLKDVEKQTEESAEYAEKQGSRITRAFSSAFRGAQGMLSSIGGATQKAGIATSTGGAAIAAPMGKAAADFSEHGKQISDLVTESKEAAKKAKFLREEILETTEAFKELNKIVELTEEQASVFKVMAERTGLSVEMLSKNIHVNSDEFKIWRQEAEKFGLVLDKDLLKSANALSDSWKRAKQAMQGLWIQVGASVADTIKELNDRMIGAVTWVTKWVKANQPLLNSIFNVARAAVKVGSVLLTVGTALATIGSALAPIAGLVAGIATAWAAWNTAIGNTLKQGATKMWAEYSDSVIKAANTIMNYGKRIIAFTDEVMGGVFDAVKGGDLELAVEILWTGAKVAWITALDEIDTLTGERLGAIFQNLAAGNWKNAAEAALNELVIIWDKMLIKVLPIFTEVQNLAEATWVAIVNSLDRAWVDIQNIWGMLRATFQDAATSILVVWEGVKTFFHGLGTFMRVLFGETFSVILGFSKAFGDSFLIILGKLTGMLKDSLVGAAKVFATPLLVTLDLVSKGMEAALGKGLDVAAMQTKLVAGAVGAVGGAHSDAIKGALSMMDDALGGGGEPVDVTTARSIEKNEKQHRENQLDERTQKRLDRAQANIQSRKDKAMIKEAQLLQEIMELEARRVELAKEGQEDADAKLEAEQAALEVQLEQARAAGEKADLDAANASQAKQIALEAAQQQEQRRIQDERQQKYLDKHDPVQRYMKGKRALEAAFKAGERDAKAFKKEVDELEYELENANFDVTVNFGTSGMDAVRAGTREEQQLIENTMQAIDKKKGKEAALAEARKRQKDIDEKQEMIDMYGSYESSASSEGIDPSPPVQGQEPVPSSGAEKGLGQVILEGLKAPTERTADALEALVEKGMTVFAPLELT